MLVNDEHLAEAYLDAARDVVGDSFAQEKSDMSTGSEDFAEMLKIVPGAYCTIGHKGNVPIHNAGFVFDDDILTVGASIYARIAERRLQA